MSLPWIFDTTPETIPAPIPYLAPPEQSPLRLEEGPQPSLKVGIAWAGRPSHPNDRNRSCALAHFRPLLQTPGIAWYSLQVRPRATDLAEIGSKVRVQDLSDQLHDFADTAAAIAQLDLVISVDTAVAHLAGALGKPVWTLLPFVPDWRWMLHREDSPWYPTMRLFRQARPGDWPGVFARVAQALRHLVEERRP